MRNWLPIICLFWLAACGIEKDPDARWYYANDFLASASLVEAFRLSVYAETRTKCVLCHGGGVGPQFAADDVPSSYTVARSLIDFNNIPFSRLVLKTQDAHCGSHCNTDGSEMARAIEVWHQAGEMGNQTFPISGTVESTSLLIPDPLPTGNTFTTITWNLDSIDPVALAGAQFQIDIQRFSTEAYRVRRPRLITRARAVRVRALFPLLNGMENPLNNAYATVDSTVGPNSNVILSPTFMIMLVDRGLGDEISISFGSIAAQ